MTQKQLTTKLQITYKYGGFLEAFVSYGDWCRLSKALRDKAEGKTQYDRLFRMIDANVLLSLDDIAGIVVEEGQSDEQE